MHTLVTTSSLSKQPIFYTRNSVAIFLYLTLRSLFNFDFVKRVLPPYTSLRLRQRTQTTIIRLYTLT
jgi:hypothetical protein